MKGVKVMDAVSLLRKIHAGDRVYGTLVTSISPSWLDKVRSTGIDFVFIDTEHIPMDRITLCYLCQAYNALELAPLTRIPSPDPFEATMALDAGSKGILAPYIETVEQVRALVGAVKYRPLKGERLRGVLDGSVQLSDGERAYFEQYNRGHFLFINIESAEALARLDALLDVPGLDGVIIGPHDLSINLGVPEQYDAPVFRDAVARVIERTLAHGKAVGNHYSFGIDPELEWVRMGMNVVLHSIDVVTFTNTMRAELNQIRLAVGEAPFVPDAGPITV